MKTMAAQRFDREKLSFEEVILVDEDVKKETENEKVLSKLKGREKDQIGFYYKNEAGFMLLHRWEVLFPG